MLRIITIGFISIAILSCASEPWDDEYFIKDHSKGHEALNCSNEEAHAIASSAIETEYPKHYIRFLEKRFSIYSPIYGEFDGVMQQRYNFKTILGYKAIEHKNLNGAYYEESIEVSLSKSCLVLDVVYFKGKIEYVY